MLSTPEVASEVFFADGSGTLAGISAGKKLVDCATLDPATMKGFSEAVAAKGGAFLEAPVSGSKGPAEQGQLIMICAGNQSLYEEIVDDLALVGKASFFLGEVRPPRPAPPRSAPPRPTPPRPGVRGVRRVGGWVSRMIWMMPRC